MNVQDIRIENSIFHTKHGVFCMEGNGIILKNCVLETTSTEPAISILNSRNLTLDHVQISGNAAKALKIEGSQTGAIHLHDTDVETRGIETGATVQKGILIKK